MGRRRVPDWRRFSPRNSILFWLAAFVMAFGGLIVFVYHLIHAEPLPPSWTAPETETYSHTALRHADQTALLQAAHLTAMAQAEIPIE